MKRKQNETPEPIQVACRQNKDTIQVLPENLYHALKPTLANDWLEWKTARGYPQTVLGYYIPARILLDLARIWKDEKYSISLHVDPDNALLIIESGFDYARGYTSRTTLKLNQIEELPEWREGRPAWATNETFIPFGFIEGAQPEQAPVYDPWIAKAASKDQARPILTRSWGDFAADGFRLHYDPRLTPTPREALPGWIEPSEVDNLRESIDTIRHHPADNYLEIDAKAFARAVKAARAVNKDLIRLNVNGCLDVYGLDEWTGRAGQQLGADSGYVHAGPDLEIGIDPRFLLDALSGFSGIVTVACGGADGTAQVAPVYITDGAREAVIMPKSWAE